ncbi:MAG: lipopolysaccharide transport periplasmic protein LptA [Burkholderiales bacterium]
MRSIRSGFKKPWTTSALLAAFCLFSSAAQAEKADRDKPIYLDSDSAVTDDAKQISTFTGKVVLTQGTLVIRADTLVLRKDPEGYQFGTATGNPASFRQKREGLNEYIEGYGQRIEYNGRANTLELFTNARMIRNQDEVRGDYISYDANSEFFKVGPPAKGTAGTPQGRVHAVIMPKGKTPATAPVK